MVSLRAEVDERRIPTHAPATKCAHGFTTGASCFTIGESFCPVVGATPSVSRDCGRKALLIVLELFWFCASAVLSDVVGKVMNNPIEEDYKEQSV